MKTNLLRSIPKLFFVWLLLAAQACGNDPDPVIPAGADGFFVVNEGAFNGSNTSISFYDRETGVMTNDVFASTNKRPLGDQAQSITVFEDKAYIVVQHSAKIEIIDADDYTSIKTITEGIESPRYFLGISSTKGYLSDWGQFGDEGTVKVIDLTNFTVIKTISTGQGANRMIRKGDDVYVANNGGFGNDNKISIIDTNKDEVTSTITVGDNPNSLQFDKDGNLWVASAGKFVYNDDFTAIDHAKSTKSTLSKIGSDNKEALRLTFPILEYPGAAQLEINKAGDRLFVNYNRGVYAIPTSATTIPTTPLIDKAFYGLAVDPFNDNIIGGEVLDFASPDKIYIYNSAGTLQKEIVVGIAPNGIGFK
jgi:YVTN family beta-propeller protein